MGAAKKSGGRREFTWFGLRLGARSLSSSDSQQLRVEADSGVSFSPFTAREHWRLLQPNSQPRDAGQRIQVMNGQPQVPGETAPNGELANAYQVSGCSVLREKIRRTTASPPPQMAAIEKRQHRHSPTCPAMREDTGYSWGLLSGRSLCNTQLHLAHQISPHNREVPTSFPPTAANEAIPPSVSRFTVPELASLFSVFWSINQKCCRPVLLLLL